MNDILELVVSGEIDVATDCCDSNNILLSDNIVSVEALKIRVNYNIFRTMIHSSSFSSVLGEAASDPLNLVDLDV